MDAEQRKKGGVYRVEWEPLEDESCNAATELATFEQRRALDGVGAGSQPIIRTTSPLSSTSNEADLLASGLGPPADLRIAPIAPIGPVAPPRVERHPMARTLALVDPALQQIQPRAQTPDPQGPPISPASWTPGPPAAAAPPLTTATAEDAHRRDRSLVLLIGAVIVALLLIGGAIVYVQLTTR